MEGKDTVVFLGIKWDATSENKVSFVKYIYLLSEWQDQILPRVK